MNHPTPDMKLHKINLKNHSPPVGPTDAEVYNNYQKRGAQASRTAYYAIGEFRHLWRLLAVHGRFSYVRTCGVINLSLYKNVMFSCTQFLFQIFCFASGTTFHNQWLVTSWNAIVTLLPPFLFGVFELDLDVETAVAVPQAYPTLRQSQLFGFSSVAEYALGYGVWHANIIFWALFSIVGAPGRTAFPNGQDNGFFFMRLAASVLAVCVFLSKFLLCSNAWAYPVISGSVLSFVLLWSLINLFPSVFHETPLEGVLAQLFRSPTFHLTWPFVFVTAFFPDFVVRLLRGGSNNLFNRLQLMEARKKQVLLSVE